MPATKTSVYIQNNDWYDLQQELAKVGESLDTSVNNYLQNVGITSDGRPTDAVVVACISDTKPEPGDFSKCFSLYPKGNESVGTIVAGDLSGSLKCWVRCANNQRVYLSAGATL